MVKNYYPKPKTKELAVSLNKKPELASVQVQVSFLNKSAYLLVKRRNQCGHYVGKPIQKSRRYDPCAWQEVLICESGQSANAVHSGNEGCK